VGLAQALSHFRATFLRRAEFMSRILIVEDNEMNADMLSRRLQRLGHEVLVAVDGQEGVDMVRTHKPDLVLMDMDLPVIDGWAATRQIKADQELRHIPVMALTAHAVVGEREKALQAGCIDYDTKPIEWSRLKLKVATILEGGH
jgi:two-component system, cell cycle response regulator DivK